MPENGVTVSEQEARLELHSGSGCGSGSGAHLHLYFGCSLRFPSLLLLDLILKEIKQKSKPKAARRHKHSKAGVELSVWSGLECARQGGEGRGESWSAARAVAPHFNGHINRRGQENRVAAPLWTALSTSLCLSLLPSASLPLLSLLLLVLFWVLRRLCRHLSHSSIPSPC